MKKPIMPMAATAALSLEGALIAVILRQHGRTLIDHGRLEERLVGLEQAVKELSSAVLAGHSAGNSSVPAPDLEPLEPGVPAPAFELASLDGGTRRLEDLIASQPALVFFDPQCGFCQSMASAIGELDDPSRMVLISRGTEAQHVELGRRHEWRCEVLLDPMLEVAEAYRTRATPTGYLVDRSGRIASSLLVGADPLLRAAIAPTPPEPQADDPREKEQAVQSRARAAGLRVKDVSASRINRNGLSAGTDAPEFSLPDVHGAIRSSDEFRGRRTLLVFSDPDCEPCQELAPRLARQDRGRGNGQPQIVMISRGDPDANRIKAVQHEIQFPVLIQPGWAVSRKYGIFSTPVGYLISAKGQVEQPVAIGADAILRLASL